MKKFSLLLLGLALVTYTFAQDAGKDLKKATRNVANYNLDPSANADKLADAKSLIDAVVQDGEFTKSSKAWMTYGRVYSEIINKDVQALVLDLEHTAEHVAAPLSAYQGFMKAHEFAVKGYEKKDAVKGLKAVINNIAYMSSNIFQREEYTTAYEVFKAVVAADKFLVSNGEESAFPGEQELNDQLYFASIAALSGELYTEAGELLEQLKAANYDNPGVFDGLIKVKNHLGDTEAASALLAEGREKYPEDKGLMFAGINEALTSGNLDAVLAPLKKAFEDEPTNQTIPSTIGNVYDQLYQKAIAEGDATQAEQYYGDAKTWFNKALEIDSSFFDAVYMMGALEYNKAAQLANEMNALSEDYSKEGTAKYDQKKDEMMTQFDLALPYFEKAEKLDETDANTLIALREIYARKNDFDRSNMYKEKIESLQNN